MLQDLLCNTSSAGLAKAHATNTVLSTTIRRTPVAPQNDHVIPASMARMYSIQANIQYTAEQDADAQLQR